MVGIYAIKNKINNKIYIGRSTDIQRRWTTHLRDARKGSLCKIHIAMRQLGNEAKKLSLIQLEEIVRLRYKEKLSYQKIADIYDKNRKTIERIFTNVYYKKEMEALKKLKPELFQS